MFDGGLRATVVFRHFLVQNKLIPNIKCFKKANKHFSN